MKSPLSILSAAFLAFGALFIGGTGAQAAAFAPAAGITADTNLVQKTHGYHRSWRRGHRHGYRYRPYRRYYGYRRARYHCHYGRYGRRWCHRHVYRWRRHRH